mgnify:CR=1 FL=1
MSIEINAAENEFKQFMGFLIGIGLLLTIAIVTTLYHADYKALLKNRDDKIEEYKKDSIIFEYKIKELKTNIKN